MKPFRVSAIVLLFALARFVPCAAPASSPFGINGAGWSHLGANTGDFDLPAGQKRLDSLAQMGAAWDRCDFWWHRIEPERGKFVWGDYDRAVDAYAKAGVHVLPILCYDAAWHPNQSPSTPEYREEYGRFVYETVKHFKGRISAYEIWNEPNGAQYWRMKPSAEDYTALLKVAYREAKRADPSVVLVGGAIAGMDWPFIEGMLKAGAGDAMDALSVHPYQGNLGSTGPEEGNLASDLRRLNALLKQYGAGKTRVWITEMGNRTVPDPAVPKGKPQPTGRVTEQQQANYLVRSCAIALSEGVERIFWFNLQDWPTETWGTITGKDFRCKPSWYAYRAMSKLLTGKQFAASGASYDDVHILAFKDVEKPEDQSRSVIVCWTEGAGVVMDVQGEDIATIHLPGQSLSAVVQSRRTVSGGGAIVNQEPLYLTGGAGMAVLLKGSIKATAVPASVAPRDVLSIKLTSAFQAVPRSDSIETLVTNGVPVLYPRDTHAPIPNGLRKSAKGTLIVGNVPPGDYLAGYRLPNGSVAAGPLRVVPAVSVSVFPNPTMGHDLSLVFSNHSSRKIAGKAVIDMIGNRTDTITRIELAPHETITENVANAQTSGTRLTDPLPVALSLSSPAGDASWSGNVYFWSAARAEPGPPLVLDSAQDWQSQDGSWSGPDDLKVTMTAQYDDQRLFLHAVVADDVFSQTYTLGEVWRGDAFQIAVDPKWSRKPDTSEATEFALALTPDGPQVYRWTGKAGLIPGAQLKVTRNGARTTYDASIPWKELGVASVMAPKTIGLAFILNDNDGKDRQGWMAYGDGIATEKRADRYATITLLP